MHWFYYFWLFVLFALHCFLVCDWCCLVAGSGSPHSLASDPLDPYKHLQCLHLPSTCSSFEWFRLTPVEMAVYQFDIVWSIYIYICFFGMDGPWFLLLDIAGWSNHRWDLLRWRWRGACLHPWGKSKGLSCQRCSFFVALIHHSSLLFLLLLWWLLYIIYIYIQIQYQYPPFFWSFISPNHRFPWRPHRSAPGGWYSRPRGRQTREAPSGARPAEIRLRRGTWLWGLGKSSNGNSRGCWWNPMGILVNPLERIAG